MVNGAQYGTLVWNAQVRHHMLEVTDQETNEVRLVSVDSDEVRECLHTLMHGIDRVLADWEWPQPQQGQDGDDEQQAGGAAEENPEPLEAQPGTDVEHGLLDDWGELVEEPVPLSAAHVTALSWHSAKMNVEEGQLPRSWHRLTSDNRLFGRKTLRQQNPSILMDCSNSMQLNHEELMDVVRRLPHTRLALYGGYVDPQDDNASAQGGLRIVCWDGKMAAPEHISSPGPCNTIDGPALMWLLNQPGPRLWITDTKVSGRHDRFDEKFNRKLGFRIAMGRALHRTYVAMQNILEGDCAPAVREGKLLQKRMLRDYVRPYAWTWAGTRYVHDHLRNIDKDKMTQKELQQLTGAYSHALTTTAQDRIRELVERNRIEARGINAN